MPAREYGSEMDAFDASLRTEMSPADSQRLIRAVAVAARTMEALSELRPGAGERWPNDAAVAARVGAGLSFASGQAGESLGCDGQAQLRSLQLDPVRLSHIATCQAALIEGAALVGLLQTVVPDISTTTEAGHC
jgi:hypothetical protein